MKNLVVIPLLIAFVASSIACNKRTQDGRTDTTVVEGKLLDVSDRSPISKGKVLVLKSYYDHTLNGIWYGRSYHLRNTVICNDQGNFTYSFKHSEDTLYAVAAEAPGFFSNENLGDFPYPHWNATGLQSIKNGFRNYYSMKSDSPKFNTEKGEIYYPEIRLAPMAWIKFEITNTAPALSNDLMRLGSEGIDANLIDYAGIPQGAVYFTDAVKAGRFVKFGYHFTSNGVFNALNDSVFVVPHDTTTVVIMY